MNALGGLPSTAINATPVPAGESAACAPLGAMMPISLKRELTSGATTVAAAATGALPSTRDRSARTAAASPTATA